MTNFKWNCSCWECWTTTTIVLGRDDDDDDNNKHDDDGISLLATLHTYAASCFQEAYV